MIYSFSDFELDTDLQELRKSGAPRTIEPQVFDLLRYLIENRQRLVSRDELFENVWQGRIVSDGTLSSRIKTARQALGDTGKAQTLIKTVPRRGFRFVADVRIGSVDDTSPGTTTSDVGQVSNTDTGPPSRQSLMRDGQPPLPDQLAIAVLPFVNVGRDPEQEYFSDGIAEDIITALSNVHSFLVIDRASSFNFKGRGIDIRTIGRELGVHYVLEGSVRRSGSRLRVSAQLVETATSHHIWARRFDATLEEIFDLQDEITSMIVGTIEPELVRAEGLRLQAKAPNNMNAYDHLLRGLAYMHKVTPEDTKKALVCFETAMELDPSYGRACAFASWCYRRSVEEHGLASLSDEDRRRGMDLARKALRCDRNDPFVMIYAACSFYEIEGDFEEALALIDRAISMNPNSHRFWNAKALVHSRKGETEAAIKAGERAISIGPNDPAIWNSYLSIAEAHLQELRFDEAAAFARSAVRHNENLGRAYLVLAAASAHLDKDQEARKALAGARKACPGLTVRSLPETYHVTRLKNLDIYLDGLRKAGLPES